MFYFVNGFLVWFILLVLKFPIMILIYAAQYHNWDVYKALFHMTTTCYVSMSLELSLQIYWFIFVLGVAFNDLCKQHVTNNDLDSNNFFCCQFC